MADQQKTKELDLQGYEVECVLTTGEWRIELSPFPAVCPNCGAPLERHTLRSGLSYPLDVLLPPDEHKCLEIHEQITLELERHKFLCGGCIRDKNGHKAQIDVGYKHTFINQFHYTKRFWDWMALAGLQFSYAAVANKGIVNNVSESTVKKATEKFLEEKFDGQRKWNGANAISLYIESHKGKPFCIIVDVNKACVMECLLCNDTKGFNYFVSNCASQPSIVYVGIDDYGQEIAKKYFPNAKVMVDEYRLKKYLDDFTDTLLPYMYPDLIGKDDMDEPEQIKYNAQFYLRKHERLLTVKRRADSERAEALSPYDDSCLNKIFADYPDLGLLDEVKHVCRALYRESLPKLQELQLDNILTHLGYMAENAPYKNKVRKAIQQIKSHKSEILAYLDEDEKTDINRVVNEDFRELISPRADNITWKNLRGLICYGAMASLYKTRAGVYAAPESVTHESNSIMALYYSDSLYKPRWKTFATIQKEMQRFVSDFSIPLDVVHNALVYSYYLELGSPDGVEKVRIIPWQEIPQGDDSEEVPLSEDEIRERVEELKELGEEHWDDDDRDFVAEYYSKYDEDDMPSWIYFNSRGSSD